MYAGGRGHAGHLGGGTLYYCGGRKTLFLRMGILDLGGREHPCIVVGESHGLWGGNPVFCPEVYMDSGGTGPCILVKGNLTRFCREGNLFYCGEDTLIPEGGNRGFWEGEREGTPLQSGGGKSPVLWRVGPLVPLKR
jgi:hypothetical protein